MNSSEQDSVDLADLISLLWRDGQRKAARRSTAQAAFQDTPHPLATDLSNIGRNRSPAPTVACLKAPQPSEDGEDDDCIKFPTIP